MTTELDIQKIYVAYFNRPADNAGLSYWKGVIESGKVSLADLTSIFATTSEYRTLYAGATNADVVAKVYQNLFGRAPEPAGQAYWVQELDAGRIDIGVVAYSALNAAGGDDKLTIDHKAEAATLFSKHLASTGSDAKYGDAMLAEAREWLGTVDKYASSVDLAEFRIQNIVPTPVEHPDRAPVIYTFKIGQDPSNIFDGNANPAPLKDFYFNYDKIQIVATGNATLTASNPSLFYFEDFYTFGTVPESEMWRFATFGALGGAHGGYSKGALAPLMAGETVLYSFEKNGQLQTYLFVDDGSSMGIGGGMDNGAGSAVWHVDGDRIINLTGIVGLKLTPDGLSVDGDIFV